MSLILGLAALANHGERVNVTSGAWHIDAKFQYRLYADTANAIAHVILAFSEATRGADAANNTTPSLLDFGAGKGHYVLFYREHGLSAAGYEGSANIEKLSHGVVKHRDLSQPFGTDDCASAADWVTCLEVAEHIHVWNERHLLRNIECSARRGVFISWAQPRQYGSGHVNLRSKAYVLERFTSLGFVYDTNATRAVSGSSLASPYLSRNMMVFRRPALPALESQAAQLAMLPPRARWKAAPAAPAAAQVAEVEEAKLIARQSEAVAKAMLQPSKQRWPGAA